MKKVLLINFCGHVLTTNTFIPDGSLAVLAASLFKYDIPVEILDLQNPIDIGKVLSAPIVNQKIGQEVYDTLYNNQPLTDELVDSFNYERSSGEDYIIDNLYNVIAQKIEKENVRLIGFKLWVGNTLKRLTRLAERIKENFPEVTLCAGGPALHYLGGLFLHYTKVFDHLTLKEGEDELLEIVSNNFNIKIPLFNADLKKIPDPLYKKIVYPNIDSFFNLRMIDDSRGCFNSCAFCSHPYFSGKKVRMRNPKDLVDDLERQYIEDKTMYFRFSGSNPPWRYVVAIGEEILKRNLKINYSLFSSFNNCRVKDLPMLRQSGLRAIFFGIESASDEILLKAHHKNNISNEHVIQTCHESMNLDIFVTLSLVYPSPFENNESRKQNLDLISKIFKEKKLGSIMIFPAFLGPGSLWWNKMDDFGFEFAENFDHQKYLLKIVDHHFDVLLPKSAIKDIGYKLNGKSVPQLFTESSNLTKEVKKMGIITDFDDSAYMFALMGKTSPENFQKEMIKELLIGNENSIKKLVSSYNRKIFEE